MRRRAAGEHSQEQDLPPIDLDTSASELQLHIFKQSWKNVSARQPIGSIENPPHVETLTDFASAILERRLTDVVRYRRESKLADKSPVSSTSSVDGGGTNLSNGISKSVQGGETNLKKSTSPAQHDNDRILLTSRCRSQLRKFVKHIRPCDHGRKQAFGHAS